MSTLRLAETCFRWLMTAYPPRFRRAHGLALFELFRDDARAAYADGGRGAVAWLMCRAAGDTMRAAPSAWLAASPRNARPPRRFHVTGWLNDVRASARHLLRAPAFTVLSVATLAAGIGANVTIFALANAVLLRPLASYQPDRVVRLAGRTPSGAPVSRFAFADFSEYRSRSATLADIVAVNQSGFMLSADSRRDEILGEVVSARYLRLLGARIAIGRGLDDADDLASAAPTAVISAALWRRRFGADPAVLGRSVLLNGSAYAVVGVADASFNGSFVGAPTDVWVPIATAGSSLGADWQTNRDRRPFALIARLRANASLEQSQTELQVIADDLARAYPAPGRIQRIELSPGTLVSGQQRTLARRFLTLLLGLVALVLFVSCANVANLLLARALGRRREFALRIALGASRAHLARLLLGESLLLAAVSGGAALMLAQLTTGLVAVIRPLPTLTLRLDARLDARVLVFAGLVTLAAAVVVGAIAALQIVAPDVGPALKEETAASVGRRSGARLRGALVAIQVSVSLMLLTGAVLFARSVRQAEAIDLGLNPGGVVVLDVDNSHRTAPPAIRAFFGTLLQRVSSLPGVEAAALSTRAPLDTSTPIARINALGPVLATVDLASPSASYVLISPRYLDVVKIPLVDGRPFDDRDDDRAPSVVIVNQTLASRLWPEGSPLGRRLWLDPQVSAEPCTVVGVARNSKYLTIGEEPQAHLYLAFAQHPRAGAAILVRTVERSDRAIDHVRATLSGIDPAVQGFFARPLTEHIAVSLLPVRLAAGLSFVVAVLGLILATVGLYALVSFLVADRTQEIGLRMALGATPAAVIRMVLGYGLRLSAIGLAVGIPVTLLATRLLASLLYGVSPTDPASFLVVSSIVLSVTMLASGIPAARALSVDPLTAMRRL
ncbi:MAG: ABC transporter permease [Acidobacteria bacterium]|nr:ABC transporter permease [Acidobacteriota bacterium]